jgi:hypothetical protein
MLCSAPKSSGKKAAGWRGECLLPKPLGRGGLNKPSSTSCAATVSAVGLRACERETLAPRNYAVRGWLERKTSTPSGLAHLLRFENATGSLVPQGAYRTIDGIFLIRAEADETTEEFEMRFRMWAEFRAVASAQPVSLVPIVN